MHLRRALLLFAIVIGLAALAASISQPADERERDTTSAAENDQAAGDDEAADGAGSAEQPAGGEPGKDAGGATEPTAEAGPPRSAPESVTLDAASEKAQSVQVDTGVPVSLSVAADASGQVDVPGLGLTATAEPLTPARFDLLLLEPGRYEVRFTAADADMSVAAGTVVAVDPER